MEVGIQPAADAAQVQAAVQKIVGEGFSIKNRYQQDEFLYKVMRTEKWAMYVILSFVLLVVAFNIVGSLSMLVIEKKHDLGILKAMGANNRFIQQIFLYEGLLLSCVGGLIGMSLGALVCWLQQTFKLVTINGESFLIDAYPVSMRLGDFALVALTVVVIALVASYFPAQRATAQGALMQAE